MCRKIAKSLKQTQGARNPKANISTDLFFQQQKNHRTVSFSPGTGEFAWTRGKTQTFEYLKSYFRSCNCVLLYQRDFTWPIDPLLKVSICLLKKYNKLYCEKLFRFIYFLAFAKKFSMFRITRAICENLKVAFFFNSRN